MLGIIPFTNLRFGKRATQIAGEAGSVKRAIVGGTGTGASDRFIQSGLNERKLPSPTDVAVGTVAGGALGGTFQKSFDEFGKILNNYRGQGIPTEQIPKAISQDPKASRHLSILRKDILDAYAKGDSQLVAKKVFEFRKAHGAEELKKYDSYEHYIQIKKQLKKDLNNSIDGIDDSLPRIKSDRPDRDGLIDGAPEDYESMWRSQNTTILDRWRLRALYRLQNQKTSSGTQYKTIDDIPDLRIPRSEVFRNFKDTPHFSEVENALYEYEYGALIHRELEGQGSLAGFRPFEGYSSRGYLDPKGESWIFRSKGTTRGVKNYQWNRAVAVSKAANKRLQAEKEVLDKLDTQLGHVAAITGVPKEEFANISKQSAIEKASREQLQQQIKAQRQELGLEGEALLHDKHLKDLHLEHVIGVSQYPEFLESIHAPNWILNRKNNHGLAGYHVEPPPIWSVILAGKHNKWFVDIVQDAFATPTRPKNKSGYKKPKLAGKDLGLGTDEGKRLFTYPEVLPNFTERGSIPGDMIISTWDGKQTWRVPRALAILDFIENKDVTRAIVQGTRDNKYKDGILARIISGEKVDISEQTLVSELMTKAKELGVNKNLLQKYWNKADLESKQEILWLLEKMGAKQEFIEQIGKEMITQKGTPYLIKGGYLKNKPK